MGQLPGCLRTVELSLRLQNPAERRPRLTRVATKPKQSRCSDNSYDDDVDDDEYLSNKDDDGHENDNCSRSCSMLECPEECGTNGEGRRVQA